MDLSKELFAAVQAGSAARVAQCVGQGVDVDAKNAEKTTALIKAAIDGKLAVVTALLNAGATVDLENKDCETALIFAARWGHADVVSKLLAVGANAEHINRKSANSLMLAAWNGKTSAVNTLVANGANVNYANVNGDTALTWAAAQDHKSNVDLLLRAGADCDHMNDDCETALHMAASKGHVDVVRKLLAAGADPDLLNKFGCTPAAMAAQRKYFSIEKLFVDDAMSAMPFFRAVKRGDTSTARQKLYQYKASRDPHNETAMHVAAKHGRLEILRLLVTCGVPMDERDVNGRTPLHSACEGGSVDAVKLLLAERADSSKLDGNGISPMATAALNGHLNVIRELSMHGASLKTISLDGRSILHHAVCHRNGLGVVEYLLRHGIEAGAGIDAQDHNGASALYLASDHGHEATVNMLLQHGAQVDLATKFGKTPRSVAKTEGIRFVLEVFYKCQQFRDRCLAMLAEQDRPPSPDQIIEVVPFITSVYDLRLLLPVVSLSDDNAAARASIFKAIFGHIINEKLVFEDHDCAFFKLVLVKCLEDKLIQGVDYHLWEQKAGNVNCESAIWVNELKQEVRQNSWRLDTHAQCLRGVVTGIKQINAAVVQNRKAVKAVETRVSRLQGDVDQAKELMKRIVARGNRLASQVEHLEKRLARSEQNIVAVATNLQEFHAAVSTRFEQEEDNKKLKFACSLLASLAGFIFAPLLKEAFNAIVDFGNPVEVFKLAYSDKDVAGFLAETSTNVLHPVVESQLEKLAIGKEEFKTVLREEIVLQYPEYLEACSKRGLQVEFHAYKTGYNHQVDQELSSEADQVREIITELQRVLESTPITPVRPATPPRPSPSPVAARNRFSSNQEDETKPTRTQAEPQGAETLAAELLAKEFGSWMSQTTSTKEQKTPYHERVQSRQPTDERNSVPRVADPEVTGNQHEQGLDHVDELEAKDGPLDWFDFEDDPEQYPYHQAVSESHGDLEDFKDFLHAFGAKSQDPKAVMAMRVGGGRVAWSALELACHLGYVEVVKYLLASVLQDMQNKEKVPFLRGVKQRAALLQRLP